MFDYLFFLIASIQPRASTVLLWLIFVCIQRNAVLYFHVASCRFFKFCFLLLQNDMFLIHVGKREVCACNHGNKSRQSEVRTFFSQSLSVNNTLTNWSNVFRFCSCLFPLFIFIPFFDVKTLIVFGITMINMYLFIYSVQTFETFLNFSNKYCLQCTTMYKMMYNYDYYFK